MTDIFPIYEKLWSHAQSLGLNVLYRGLGDDGAGIFHPHTNGSGESFPTIEIVRRYYDVGDRPSRERNADGRSKLPPPDLLLETVTLAHEIGHFLSWHDRTPRETWKAYFQAVCVRDHAWDCVSTDGSTADYNERLRAAAQAALSHNQLQLIVEEEERAWALGRDLLLEHGFNDIDYFDGQAAQGVYFHRYRLGLVPLSDRSARHDAQTHAAQQGDGG